MSEDVEKIPTEPAILFVPHSSDIYDEIVKVIPDAIVVTDRSIYEKLLSAFKKTGFLG